MKSGLLSNATRIARIFSTPPTSTRTIAMSRGLTLSEPTGKCKSADPKVHGGETEVSDTITQGIDSQIGEAGDYSTDRHDQELRVADKTYVAPNPPNPSSPKFENIPVNKPTDPMFQQKRRCSTSSTVRIEDVGCVGFDGSPWPEDGRDIKTQKEEQQEEDREYFKNHKASPLSEIEVADTRKPLTKVTDGTAGGYFGGEQVITFTPEQIDTAEDSLLRAARMWKEAAVRGVPEYPHSRRLRELRGEDW